MARTNTSAALAPRLCAAVVVLLVVMVAPSAAGASQGRQRRPPPLTPIVVFPGFHFSKLTVTVDNQVAAPDCPRSGTFEDWFQNDQPNAAFSQVCRDKLLTLRYDSNPSKPMSQRFSNQDGVTVSNLDYGQTRSAPFYEAMYQSLEAAGYTRNRNIRVAGYDGRLSPDLGGFLDRTKKLIEDTYRDNGHTPVHLVGHSNGPLYAQYLLTHTSREWRDRYIHGFTPIAGNFPGQGLVYPVLFTGFNVVDFSLPTTAQNAASSARMHLSSPGFWMSAADPKIFGSREVVVEDASSGRDYTPADYRQLLADAGLGSFRDIADYYIGFVSFAPPASFPYVDVYAEKGSGIETVVGAALPDLSVGQVLDASTAHLFTRDGDVNQEDITNAAVNAWQAMACFRFGLVDNPGVDHFSLPGDPTVLARLNADVARPRSDCPHHGRS